MLEQFPTDEDHGRAVRSTPGELSAAAASLFTRGPLLMRLLQRGRPFICPFHRLLALVPPQSRLLDVGCGGGLFLGLLAHYGLLKQGTGFDTSQEAVRVAQKMADRWNLARSAAEGQLLSIAQFGVEDPWPEGPFGVVSIIDVLHHVPLDARRGLFEQAAAHLRQGGLLIYKDMAQRPVWKATANRIHDLILARQWIHYLPVELVEQWMAELGFRLTQSEEISMYAYQHQLRVFEKKGR